MSNWSRWLAILALLLLVVASLFPFYWAVVSSLTPEARLFKRPSLWPDELVTDHYQIGRASCRERV